MSGYIQLHTSTVKELIATLQRLHPNAVIKVAETQNIPLKKEKRSLVLSMFYNDKEVVFQTEGFSINQ
ncbi:MAG: hypothetical protein EOM50_08385 [Erysipelotrichia bacterium]|nr:hypothetical protein [Erysipelotrichia bacterium]